MEPLELPKPEEKLLRSPTFFEKYGWVKPVAILAILISTIILSSYLLKANNPAPDTISITPSPTTFSPKLSCRPRPACLDSVPSCIIPETPDMCPKASPTSSMIACPADATECPDGTWVPRTGPNCEFVCPQPTNTFALKNACQEKGGTWLDQYRECESIPTDQGLDQSSCSALGGKFNDCDSSCRHNNNPQQACILVCVKTCKFN